MEGTASNGPIEQYKTPREESAPELKAVSPEIDLFAHLNFERLQPYTQEELRVLFRDDEIGAIYDYQAETCAIDEDSVEDLISYPLPQYDNEKYVRRLRALANNTGSYDDEVEDEIASDEIMQKLRLQLSSREVRSPELAKKIAEATRIRRSLLAHRHNT